MIPVRRAAGPPRSSSGRRLLLRCVLQPGRPRRRPPRRYSAGRADPARRYPLLVIDEVGYISFGSEAANLFFQLVYARSERASLIVTSNKPFGRWGEVFGDAVAAAAAMIDRLVHHAEVIALRGDSYRLRTAT